MKSIRRILVALGILVCTATAAQAATPIDLRFSYGGYTMMDATDMHDGWGNVKSAWGAINLGVDFNVTNKISIGPSYTFSSTSTKGDHHSNIAYHAIMLNGRYSYYRNSIVKLYGHLGMGVVISHMQPKGGDPYNCTYFGLQLTPLGAEVGLGNGFAMFGELGFGVQGLLQVGVKLSL